MIGDGIHGNGKGQNVRAHAKDQEYRLRSDTKFPAKWAK
jgi:hypothetical protein